jgi:hypothetical protein
MTFNNFLSLAQDQQIRILIQKGVRVSKREENGCKYCLYQIGNFYVELIYDFDTLELLKMRKFKCTSFLEPYLKNISLKNILKKVSFVPLAELFEIVEPFSVLYCV